MNKTEAWKRTRFEDTIDGFVGTFAELQKDESYRTDEIIYVMSRLNKPLFTKYFERIEDMLIEGWDVWSKWNASKPFIRNAIVSVGKEVDLTAGSVTGDSDAIILDLSKSPGVELIFNRYHGEFYEAQRITDEDYDAIENTRNIATAEFYELARAAFDEYQAELAEYDRLEAERASVKENAYDSLSDKDKRLVDALIAKLSA